MENTIPTSNHPVAGHPKRHLWRNALIAVVAVGIGVLSYLAYQNPDMFKAEITGGGDQDVDTDFYVPSNYYATAGDTGYIELKAGKDMINVNRLYVRLAHDTSKISLLNVSAEGTILETNGNTVGYSVPATGQFLIKVNDTTGDFTPVIANIKADDVVARIFVSLDSDLQEGRSVPIGYDQAGSYVKEDGVGRQATGTPGEIVISSEGQCGEIDCGDYGTCNPFTGLCECQRGYAGFTCSECDVDNNYTGYPDCQKDIFGALEAIDLEIDGITPPYTSPVIIHPTDSYELIASGDFADDADNRVLNLNEVTYVVQPVNRLDDAALAAGLMERGDVSGTAQVFAEIQKADETFVRSNMITVTVPLGPIIEYSRLIGGDDIVRGGRINMNAKVSDVHQISDIQDIRTSIVRTDQTGYDAIDADPNAIWFTAVQFEDVQVDSGGTEDGENEEGNVVPDGRYFAIYNIPIEIPQDNNLTDGDYKLVMEITDTAGYLATAVASINVGASVSGDVNGDGKVGMLDVLMAFQISSGDLSPTPEQFQAADLNQDNKVTMLDVVTLFNQVSQ